eukprot:276676-Rhodomonas_salina.1
MLRRRPSPDRQLSARHEQTPAQGPRIRNVGRNGHVRAQVRSRRLRLCHWEGDPQQGTPPSAIRRQPPPSPPSRPSSPLPRPAA